LYDVYQFRQAKQGNTETLDQYYTRLRSLSQYCDFAAADFEIVLQIVLYGTSSRLSKQALCDPKITLELSLWQVASSNDACFKTVSYAILLLLRVIG
jgi:hypothetical protein